MIVKKLLVSFTICMLTACNLIGCSNKIVRVNNNSSEVVKESKSIKLDGAKKCKVKIEMGAGRLYLNSGDSNLLDADFEYSSNYKNPKLEYGVSNGEGNLDIVQTKVKSTMNSGEYNWNLAMNKEVPLDMHIQFGAGESKLDLSKLNLSSLVLECGVGEVTADISGEYKNNVNVNISSGVGQFKLYLPKNMGAKIKAGKGIGGLKISGFKVDGDYYVNDSYGKTKNNINVDIGIGVGEIEVNLK